MPLVVLDVVSTTQTRNAPQNRRALPDRLRAVALALAALLLLGGCSVPWKVVRQSGPPSALVGASAAAIQFDYSTMLVEGMSQDAWVSQQTAKEAEYAKTWAELKARFEETYLNGFREEWGTAARLAEGAAKPAGTVLVQVKVNSLDMGHFIPFATTNSQVTVNVVWDVQAPDDEIMVSGTDTPSPVNVSIFQHIGNIGQYLGKTSAEFLKSKQ